MIYFSTTPEEYFSSAVCNVRIGLKKSIFMHIDEEKPIFVIKLTRFPGDQYSRKYNYHKAADLTQQLIDNNGVYATFHGSYSPYGLLETMEKNDSLFAKEPGRSLKIYHNKEGHRIQVSGNLEKISRAFNFCFFNEHEFDRWLEQAKSIDPYAFTTMRAARKIESEIA